MNFKNLSIVSILFIGMTTAFSANAELKDYYDECMSKYDYVNNMRIYECSGYADQNYKSAMNKAYNKIYKSLKVDGRYAGDAGNFEKSQLGWLDYRDQHCALEGMYIGSPALPICVSSKNKERAEELINFSRHF